MNRTVVFIQARMSSTRFPGKVIEPLQGLPMIVFMVQRARQATLVDDVMVLTSTDASDDLLADTVRADGIGVHRGSLEDVLKRFADAAAVERATEIVRLTGDCPLIDPTIIDAVIQSRRDAGAEYSSNVDPPTFPDGLDVECFTRAVLERANTEAKTIPEREHVTPWMRNDATGLSRANYQALADFSHIRLTVDYPDDLVAVRRLTSLVGRNSERFDFYDLLRGLAAQPDILSINRHTRNEGLAKSLLAHASGLDDTNSVLAPGEST